MTGDYCDTTQPGWDVHMLTVSWLHGVGVPSHDELPVEK